MGSVRVRVRLDKVHDRGRVLKAVGMVPAVRLDDHLDNSSHRLVGVPDLMHILVVGYALVCSSAYGNDWYSRLCHSGKMVDGVAGEVAVHIFVFHAPLNQKAIPELRLMTPRP